MATFVLIPGAGGQAWYWHRLVPELERRGHDAVAVDLPSGDDTAGLDAYTDAVVAAVDGRGPVVVVGQSMGGFTAPLVCERVPVELLVLLNAMIPLPGETGGEWWSVTGHEADDADFLDDVPDDVAAEARRLPFEQSARPFEDPWPLQRWPSVPTRVLAARDDRFFRPDFQRRIAADRLGLDVDEIPGGHLVALSHPVELADRLEAYLTSR
jgi:pimeloyl-ACP methyl ester carboxylesterase